MIKDGRLFEPFASMLLLVGLCSGIGLLQPLPLALSMADGDEAILVGWRVADDVLGFLRCLCRGRLESTGPSSAHLFVIAVNGTVDETLQRSHAGPFVENGLCPGYREAEERQHRTWRQYRHRKQRPWSGWLLPKEQEAESARPWAKRVWPGSPISARPLGSPARSSVRI